MYRLETALFSVLNIHTNCAGRCLRKFADIDLAIVADAPVDSNRLSDLKEVFSESDLPYRVDVVDVASGRVLYCG